MNLTTLDFSKYERRWTATPQSTIDYNKVYGVVTEQGYDRSDMINEWAANYGVPPRLLVALAIAESNLDEYSRRPKYDSQIDSYWPDVSYGAYQQAVKWAPVGDGSPSLDNCHFVQEWLNEFSNALDTAVKYLAPFWLKYQDPIEAMCRYNSPGISQWDNQNRANYQRGWDMSAEYETSDSNSGGDSPPDLGVTKFFDVRDQFPYYPGNGEYDSRSLSAITQVIYHHGASAMPDATYEAEMAMLQQYHDLHTKDHGWPAIAYHFAVGSSGNIYWCNGLDLVTYHAMQANPYSIGIVWIGNFESEMPPPQMLISAVAARLWSAQQCGRAEFPYIGHRDAVQTTCPGNWWEENKNLLQTYPDDGSGDMDAQLQAENERLQAENAALVSKVGYLQGDVANAIDEGAQLVLSAKNVGQAKEVTRSKILPGINTLKTS